MHRSTVSLSILVFLGLWLPSTALATVAPSGVKLRWLERPATGLQKGHPFQGRFEVIAGRAGAVTDLRVETAGWTQLTLDAPQRLALGKGDRRVITVTGTPAADDAPLVVHGTHDGLPFEKHFRLDRASLEKSAAAGRLTLESGARTLGSGTRARPGGQVIRFRGRFVYTRGDGQVLGADSLVMRIRDDDSPDPFDDTIWEGTTDRNGNFDVTVNWDDCDILGCDDPDVYLEFTTGGARIDVQRDDLLETTYLWSTENQVIDDFTGSEIDFGTLRPADGAEDGAVHVWNGVLRAYRYFEQRGGGVTLPLVDVLWPSDAATSYSAFFEEISIRADRTWNEVSHAHETMHHVENTLGHLDPPQYGSAGHFVWCAGSNSDGWQEGVANWFGRRVAEQQQPLYGQLAWSAGTDGMGNANDNRYGMDGLGTCSGTPNPGAGTEGYVMALLRDIEDANTGVDDHDGATPCDRDAMALGDSPIFEVVRETGPETVFDFIDNFRLRFGQHDQDLWSTVRNVDPTWGFPVPPPVVTLQGSGCRIVSAGETVVIQVTGSGSLLAYQWRRNGVPLANGPGVLGAQMATLVLSSVTPASSGSYSCLVTTCDGSLSAVSSPFSLTVGTAGTAEPLVSWGENFSGQVGDGTQQGPRPPRVHTGMTDIVGADGGRSFTVALHANGTVSAWGNAQWGELGDGNFFAQRNSPAPVQGLSNVVQIACATVGTLALLRDGTLVGWGYNGYGLHGDGTQNNHATPVASSLVQGCVRAIACGDYHAIALMADGTVQSWGYNNFGCLGRSVPGSWSVTPGNVTGLTDVIAISALAYGNLALKSDGTVWAWGWNNSGQLGDGTTENRSTPVRVGTLTNIREIRMGYFNGYALDNAGATWAWGANALIGDGNLSAPTPRAPTAVAQLAGALKIDTGGAGSWSMALMPGGAVVAWGDNYNQVFGTATPSARYTPAPVPGPANITGIAATYGTAHAFGSLAGIVDAEAPTRPAKLALSAAPSPAVGAVSIAFELPAAGGASLEVLDPAGRRVRTLHEGPLGPGRHVVRWDGRGGAGGAPMVGVFFLRLSAGGEHRVTRVVRVR